MNFFSFGKKPIAPLENAVPSSLREKFLDQHGQPLNLGLNEWRRNDRSIHELLGMIKGILADDVVCPAEVLVLAQWLLTNVEPNAGWPLDVVCSRVAKVLEDGVIDDHECAELAEFVPEDCRARRTDGRRPQSIDGAAAHPARASADLHRKAVRSDGQVLSRYAPSMPAGDSRSWRRMQRNTEPQNGCFSHWLDGKPRLDTDLVRPQD